MGNSESPGGSEGRPSSCRELITSVNVAEHFPGLSLPVRNSQHIMGRVFATEVGLWSPQSINVLLQPCCGGRRCSLQLHFGGLQVPRGGTPRPTSQVTDFKMTYVCSHLSIMPTSPTQLEVVTPKRAPSNRNTHFLATELKPEQVKQMLLRLWLTQIPKIASLQHAITMKITRSPGVLCPT